ncbi:MAG TPA: TonB-dependent receptor [Hellea balneolensis]|uniref:TonB-dependent receptor n=1 Tax=Hellea balneolensis TaxID=287478 RepID=A0A7C3C529_9PROT|nr:TonB-dependent receptor [Hellea balneolensis]
MLSASGFQLAYAQETGDSTDKAKRDEIVVTATRREETVSDIPYNISATSGVEIEKANILDNAELLRSIPGISTIDRGERNSGTINAARIRGLAVDSSALGDFAVSSVASVSTYINDTPIFANFTLRDLERVEVLRGPQGTLYGSGSLGGTVRYITRDPILGENGGNVSASLSSVNGSDSIGYSIDGVLNVALGDKAALRVVGNYGDYPGITDYVNVYELDANGFPVTPNGIFDRGGDSTNYLNFKDADTFDTWMGRATLLLEPNENTRIKLSHIRQSDDVGGRRQRTVGVDGFGNPYGEYENGSIQLEPSSRDLNMTSLEAEFDLGFATLTSSTSHYDHNGESISENTGFYAQAGFLAFYYNYPRPYAQANRTYADEAVIQELRLVSNKGEQFDYIIGGFYRKQQLEATQDSELIGFQRWFNAAFPFAVGAVTGDNDFLYRRTENFKEVSAYGEFTWHANDKLDLTLGARYFDNTSKNDTFIDLPLYASLANPTNAFFEASEDDVLFKFNLAYKATDQDLVYATISEGYRRGGSNAVPLNGTFAEDPRYQIYTPDTVVNYEVGIKGTRANLSYDLSAFYIDWSDPQLNVGTTNFGFFAVQNGGKARTYGLEASLNGYLNDDWHYSLGYAYVNAKLSQDMFAPDRPSPAAPIALDGARLPGTPEHQINAALDYTTDMGSWTSFTRVDGYYQSSTRNVVGTSPRFDVGLGGFAILNASQTFSKDAVSLSLWIKNITNEAGVTGVFTEAYMGTAPAIEYFGNANKELIALPRTLGATVRYDF